MAENDLICPWRWESIVTASRHVTPEFAKEINCIREKCAMWQQVGRNFLPTSDIFVAQIEDVYGCARR